MDEVFWPFVMIIMVAVPLVAFLVLLVKYVRMKDYYNNQARVKNKVIENLYDEIKHKNQHIDYRDKQMETQNNIMELMKRALHKLTDERMNHNAN